VGKYARLVATAGATANIDGSNRESRRIGRSMDPAALGQSDLT
jgi:hypothetical protein